MGPTKIIQLLWQYGHFFSPEAMAVGSVQETDLPTLTLQDAVVMAAVHSYQKFFKADLDQLTMRAVEFGGHRRESIPDGDVGPSTVDLLKLPRCGVADFLPATESPLEANWPTACRNEITTSYAPNMAQQIGVPVATLEALWKEADANWEREFELQMPLRLGDYPNTRIFAFAANLQGSVLADQYLATGNCGFRSQGRVDVRDWTSQLLVTTLSHEHGHALGLNHLNNSLALMYPSIHAASLARRGAPHESDIAAMVALGYRRRTSPPAPPAPPVPPTTNKYRVTVESDSPIRVVS